MSRGSMSSSSLRGGGRGRKESKEKSATCFLLPATFKTPLMCGQTLARVNRYLCFSNMFFRGCGKSTGCLFFPVACPLPLSPPPPPPPPPPLFLAHSWFLTRTYKSGLFSSSSSTSSNQLKPLLCRYSEPQPSRLCFECSADVDA